MEPFHLTLEVGTKPLPLTVKVNAVPPALAEVGLMVPMEGSGLFTVKVRELDVPPPGVGLLTVTVLTAPLAISFAPMVAVN